MEHIAAILLLVGCSDDLRQCHEIPAPAAIYETAEDCTANLGAVLSKAFGKSPQLLAKCVMVDPLAAEEDAELVWDIDAAGNLLASVEIVGADVMVASNDDESSLRN